MLAAEALQALALCLRRQGQDSLGQPATQGNMTEGGFFRFDGRALRRSRHTQVLPLARLLGIERQKSILLENSLRLAKGQPAQHVLLWGARGAGKSSLVKAICGAVMEQCPEAGLCVVQASLERESEREALLDCLWGLDRPVILFADELSLGSQDGTMRQLKTLLDGGVEDLPASIRIYATSNRKHLIRRLQAENEPLRPKEDQDESISLSDRFGLSLGFYPPDQAAYLDIVATWLREGGLAPDAEPESWQPAALEWAMQRGARSGRTARQFADDFLAAQAGPINAPTSGESG